MAPEVEKYSVGLHAGMNFVMIFMLPVILAAIISVGSC